jgi:3-oxoacyl-[acyl-carrier-protein] synthase III
MAYDEATIRNNFMYHAPKEENIQKFKEIRAEGRLFAKLVMDEVPECAERTLAFRKIEEAVMWANAALARNQTEKKYVPLAPSQDNMS